MDAPNPSTPFNISTGLGNKDPFDYVREISTEQVQMQQIHQYQQYLQQEIFHSILQE